MQHIRTLAVATTHQVYRGLLVASGRDGRRTGQHTDASPDRRDRGAVSLEQVLWFVAAGVSVAVIASILWSQIRDEAERPVQTPASP
jgi:hypothetical protein